MTEENQDDIQKELDELVVQPEETNASYEPTKIPIVNKPEEVPEQPIQKTNWENEIAKEKLSNTGEQIPTEVIPETSETTLPDSKNIPEETKEPIEKPNHIPAPGTTSLLEAGLILNRIPSEVKAAIDEYTKSMTEPEIELLMEDKNSWLNALATTELNGTQSAHTTFWKQALTELKERGEEISTVLTDIKDSVATGGNFSDMLHGKNAEMAFISSLQGLKKIYLHNSGFYVKIRPFKNEELHEFFRSVDYEKKEYGRLLGGHFYLVQDVFIKHKFMDLFPSSVVDSNLKGWKEGNTLEKTISILDYETLLWAHCSLMYRKGIEVPMVCVNPDCRHQSHGELMDVDKFRVINRSKLNSEAIKFLQRESVTKKECAEYVKSIIGETSNITYGDTRIDLLVPSIHEVLKYGDEIFSTITSNVIETENNREETILGNSILNYNKCFVPWVNTVHYMNEDKSIKFSSMDNNTKAIVLEIEQGSEASAKMNDKIKKFMKASRISFICYQLPKCEECGLTPSDELDKYQAWDAQDLFFVLSYRKMEPIR